MAIHERTDIDSTATISDDCEIGPGVVIGPDTVIESGVSIGPNVVIGPRTTIRKGAVIYPGAILGLEPQDFKYDGAPTTCEIGERTIIREYCTVNRGTKASGATIVGSDCMLMTYAHVGHDCRVGNKVVLAGGVLIGGHCTVEDLAILGGNVAMHQFTRIGKLAMVGGLAGLRQDAPPFMITAGYPPAVVYGVNSIGLRRNGITVEARQLLKDAFRILYRSGLNRSDALAKIIEEIDQIPEIKYLVEFYGSSKRGVARGSLTQTDIQ